VSAFGPGKSHIGKTKTAGIATLVFGIKAKRRRRVGVWLDSELSPVSCLRTPHTPTRRNFGSAPRQILPDVCLFLGTPAKYKLGLFKQSCLWQFNRAIIWLK